MCALAFVVIVANEYAGMWLTLPIHGMCVRSIECKKREPNETYASLANHYCAIETSFEILTVYFVLRVHYSIFPINRCAGYLC